MLAEKANPTSDQHSLKRGLIGFYHFKPFGIGGIDVLGLWFDTVLSRTISIGLNFQSLNVFGYSESVTSLWLLLRSDRLALCPKVRCGVAQIESEIVDAAALLDLSLFVDIDAGAKAFINLTNPFCIASLLEHERLASSISIGGQYWVNQSIRFGAGLEKTSARRSGLITDVKMTIAQPICVLLRLRTYPEELGIGISSRIGSLTIGVGRLLNLDLGCTDIVSAYYQW